MQAGTESFRTTARSETAGLPAIPFINGPAGEPRRDPLCQGTRFARYVKEVPLAVRRES